MRHETDNLGPISGEQHTHFVERFARGSLQPEFARQFASELAEQMRSLGERAERFGLGQTGRIAEGVFLTRLPYKRPRIELSSCREKLAGIGSGEITFLYNLREQERFFALDLGVEANTMLHLGLHMDEPTMLQANSLLASEDFYRAAFQTSYFFDERGNFGKLSVLPKEIAGQRPSVEGWAKKYIALVASVMTPADFEIAGASLRLLDARLRDLEPGQQNSPLPTLDGPSQA